MTQAIVIAIVVSIALADELSVFPIRAASMRWGSLAVLVLPFVVLLLVSHAWFRVRIGHADFARSVRRADRAILFTRLGILVVHGVVVFGFGMLDAVRGIVGDLVLVDEALTAAPALLAVVWTWVMMYPTERAISMLGDGARVPSRGSVVTDHVRHDMLLYLVPITALVGWSEWIDGGAWALPEWGRETIRWGGVAVILCGAPFVLRAVWNTTPFPEGAMREQLEGLARAHGVRYHALRVWHPRAAIANAAVIGPVRFSRIILLTETLVDRLPDDQIEAVMAHEVAHARRRHLPWMMGGLLSVLMLAWVGAWRVVEWCAGSLMGIEIDAWASEAMLAGALLPAGIVSLFVFRYISRRFEYQADAFAAAHLSVGSDSVTESGADTMAHALLGVAHLNHLAVEKRTFRHGSIAGRVERLYRLAGAARWRTPIDREVLVIKGAIALLGAGLITWMVLGA